MFVAARLIHVFPGGSAAGNRGDDCVSTAIMHEIK
jgi:hypothetical protein